jgi:hypothetical protein
MLPTTSLWANVSNVCARHRCRRLLYELESVKLLNLLNTVMENVLNDFCGVTSWHCAVAHVCANSISSSSCSYRIVVVMAKRYLQSVDFVP